MPVAKSFTARISDLREAAARARTGTFSAEETTDALIAASQLVQLLHLRAFPVGGDETDRLEQVVVTVHGVDVSVRGRPGDVFVHVEDERGDERRRTFPLVVEVNNAGEMAYGEHWDNALD